MQNAPAVWHREVISGAVEHALRDLQRQSVLADFYLAGGTGLALHLGHRRSLDLDFFSGQAFDPEALVPRLQEHAEFSLISRDKETLHVHVLGTKVSFLGYHYPVLFPFAAYLDVQIADPRDIACMKISAIAGRGTRRDFVDLYAACQRYELRELLDLFQRKFGRVSMIHVMKSLTYFDEAETEPMPEILVPLSWEQAKKSLIGEVRRML